MNIVLFRYFFFFLRISRLPRVSRPTEKYGNARSIICVEINFVSIARTLTPMAKDIKGKITPQPSFLHRLIRIWCNYIMDDKGTCDSVQFT